MVTLKATVITSIDVLNALAITLQKIALVNPDQMTLNAFYVRETILLITEAVQSIKPSKKPYIQL